MGTTIIKNPEVSSTALITRFETAFGMVELSPDTVVKYLAKGQGFTDQDIKLFIELCKYQKLNPFVGEAHLIKFGEECQMVVGYTAYVRRAEEFPDYVRKDDGITVQRGEQIVQKPGHCVYPGEKLVGAWCVVYKMKNGKEMSCGMTEVQLEEYIQYKRDGTINKNWKTKPATMIHKVAVSQALRAAFPKDFAGMYVEEESHVSVIEADIIIDDPEITQEQRQTLFDSAKSKFGKGWKEVLTNLCVTEFGLHTTIGMKTSQFEKLLKIIVEFEPEPAEIVAPVEEPEIEYPDCLKPEGAGIP